MKHYASDSNLFLFHLRGGETVLKREKVNKCFVQDCLKIFLLVLISLKMHGNSQNDHFPVEKSKTST